MALNSAGKHHRRKASESETWRQYHLFFFTRLRRRRVARKRHGGSGMAKSSAGMANYHRRTENIENQIVSMAKSKTKKNQYQSGVMAIWHRDARQITRAAHIERRRSISGGEMKMAAKAKGNVTIVKNRE